MEIKVKKIVRTIVTAAAIGICSLGFLSGCTTEATRGAISSYRQVQDDENRLFDRSLEVANQYMYLSLSTYLKDHPDPATQSAGLQAAWQARQNLEELRVQFSYQRAKSNLTVGDYLYDQQGWANAVFGDIAQDGYRTSTAATAADKAAGVKSITDIIPLHTPVTPADAAKAKN